VGKRTVVAKNISGDCNRDNQKRELHTQFRIAAFHSDWKITPL
jgi:hypothetical protein